MKLSFSILLFVCLAATSKAQFFEGQVIYKTSYVSRTPGTTDKMYNTMLGNTQTYYIKQGDYKCETNGTFLLWQVYISKQQKIYSKIAHSPTILWEDATAKADKITSVELHKNAVTILGYLCDELILHFESDYQKYYFNSSLGIDSKLYTNHSFNNWNTYLSKTNALPLKMVFRSKKHIMESTATAVKPMKLSSNLFTLPQDSRTEKNMF